MCIRLSTNAVRVRFHFIQSSIFNYQSSNQVSAGPFKLFLSNQPLIPNPATWTLNFILWTLFQVQPEGCFYFAVAEDHPAHRKAFPPDESLDLFFMPLQRCSDVAFTWSPLHPAVGRFNNVVCYCVSSEIILPFCTSEGKIRLVFSSSLEFARSMYHICFPTQNYGPKDFQYNYLKSPFRPIILT